MNRAKRFLMGVNSLIRQRLFGSKRMVWWLFGVEVVGSPDMQSYFEWCTILQRIIMRRYVWPGAKVLDLGTGAHAILAVFSRKMFPHAVVVATDILPERVNLARLTAAKNGVYMECVVADMFDGLSSSFDLILFDPPAIPSEELEVLGYELKTYPGLGSRRCWSGDGGQDGKEIIRSFVGRVGEYLTENGYAIMCINPLHCAGKEVKKLCQLAGLTIERTYTLLGITNAYVMKCRSVLRG